MIDLNSPHFSELVSKIGISGKPVTARVATDPEAIENECFKNVAYKVQKDGGTIAYGWQFHRQPFSLEAEFHAVWQDSDGSLWDVSPKRNGEKDTLFLIDQTRAFDGRQVDNVRISMLDNLLVDDYIALAEAKFRMMNSGARAFQTGPLTFDSPAETQMFQGISNLMVTIEQMLAEGKSRASLCPCNSNLKFKQCHGKDLIFKLRQIS